MDFDLDYKINSKKHKAMAKKPDLAWAFDGLCNFKNIMKEREGVYKTSTKNIADVEDMPKI